MTAPPTSRRAAARAPRLLPPGWRRVWVPLRGWRVVGPDHRQKVEDAFRTPMMVLAAMLLPLVALEYWVTEALVERPVLAGAVWAALGLIWAVFLVEFIVKFAIADSRWRYLQRNWLDVIVLLLPFLRLLRAVRALKALALLKLAQGFTLRGLFLKIGRSLSGVVLGAELTRRLFRVPELSVSEEDRERSRLQRLSRRQLLDEVMRLRRLQARMSEALLAQESAAEEPGGRKPGAGPDAAQA